MVGATYESPLPPPSANKKEGDKPFPSGCPGLQASASFAGGTRKLYAFGLVVMSEALPPQDALHSTANPQVSSTAVSSFS